MDLELPGPWEPSLPEVRTASSAVCFRARGTIASVEDLRRRLRGLNAAGQVVVVVRADAAVGPDHLREALRRALRYHRQNPGLRTTVDVDALRFIACCRQIDKALRRVGLGTGTTEVAGIASGRLRADEVCAALGLEPLDGPWPEATVVPPALGLPPQRQPTSPLLQVMAAMALLDLELPRRWDGGGEGHADDGAAEP